MQPASTQSPAGPPFGAVPAWLILALAVFVLPLGILLAVLTPPGEVADEASHMLRAATLAQGVVVGHRTIAEDPITGTRFSAGVDYDPALVAVAVAIHPKEKLTAERDAWARSLRWSGTTAYLDIGTLAVYLPAFYAPAAIAVGVARAFGGKPFDVIRSGRLASFAVFLALGGTALWVARRAHACLFCVLAVPMTVSLAGSFNQDGLIIASGVLAAALLSRSLEPGLAPERVARQPAYIVAAVLIGLICTVKLPYLPLAAMLLIPLPRHGQWSLQRRAMRRRLVVVAIIAAVAMLWTAVTMATVSAPVVWGTMPGGPLWPGDPHRLFDTTSPIAQLRVFAAHPSTVVTLVWNTIAANRTLVMESIGVLGSLELTLPKILYDIWKIAAVVAVAAALLSPRRPAPGGGAAFFRPIATGLGWADALLLTVAAVVIVWAIYISQYLTWTVVGADHIDGPTGRYFLPFLPMLAIAIPRLPLAGVAARIGGWAWGGLTLAPAAAALTGLVLVPQLIVNYWYLR